jgi:hypothetical protein
VRQRRCGYHQYGEHKRVPEPEYESEVRIMVDSKIAAQIEFAADHRDRRRIRQWDHQRQDETCGLAPVGAVVQVAFDSYIFREGWFFVIQSSTSP